MDPDPPRPLLTSPAVAHDLDADLAEVRRTASDRSQPLLRRLDAFEDLFESEVGDTMLVRARNLERTTGLRQLFLKFEGDNPSGTQKDRIAFAQAMDALRRGFDCVTVATCGNYGVAIAFAVGLAGLRCVVMIPEGNHSKRLGEIEARGAELVRVPGDYEDAVEASRRYAAEHEVYDANPGGANEILQLRAYREVAYEIYDQLRDAPAACAVPVSNGTTLAGVHRGFVSLHRRGKTSRIPRLVGGSASHQNPVIHAWHHDLPTAEDLSPEVLEETRVNEPLINWHAIDGDLALQAIRATGGWAEDVTDKKMKAMAKTLREQQGLHVLPASTAGLIALLERHARDPLPPDRYVAVLTGRNA